MSEQKVDWEFHCHQALKQLHEALDVIEDIDSECLLPPQLQDRVDVVLAPRRENERQANLRLTKQIMPEGK